MSRAPLTDDLVTSEKQLRARVERRYRTTFWGVNYFIRPRLCNTVFGDGRVLISFTPLDTRPNYYVVRVDSHWDIEHGLGEHVDAICEAIEGQFGSGEDEDTDDQSRAFPALSDSCGVCWGRINRSDINWMPR